MNGIWEIFALELFFIQIVQQCVLIIHVIVYCSVLSEAPTFIFTLLLENCAFDLCLEIFSMNIFIQFFLNILYFLIKLAKFIVQIYKNIIFYFFGASGENIKYFDMKILTLTCHIAYDKIILYYLFFLI